MLSQQEKVNQSCRFDTCSVYMVHEVLIDLWVGVICEENAFKSMQQKADAELGEGVIYLRHLKRVSDTYSTKFSFVVDLVKNGTEDYDRLIRELKYRKIPIISTPSILNHIINLMEA